MSGKEGKERRTSKIGGTIQSASGNNINSNCSSRSNSNCSNVTSINSTRSGSTTSCGHTVAFDNSASWAPLDTLMMSIKKREKYQDSTTLPPESLEDGKWWESSNNLFVVHQ
jgi:hypothetical protein